MMGYLLLQKEESRVYIVLKGNRNPTKVLEAIEYRNGIQG